MVANWEREYPQVCIPKRESLLDVKARLKCILNEKMLNRKLKDAVLLIGHAILWMCFIRVFCETRPLRINDGFMNKSHLSLISKNGKEYGLEQNNLNNK